MSYRINPDGYCQIDGCSRPKATGEELGPLCSARTSDPEAGTGSTSLGEREVKPDLSDYVADEAKLPRCVAYLSQAGDVITLELTGEPKFTEADVALVASALTLRNAA
jgi:hypothetical protein